MTTTFTEPAAIAQEAMDAVLPRRSPQYESALKYLTAYLQADAPTRRLAMRALKAAALAPQADTENA